MTRYLLFGKDGQLGWELQQRLAALGEVTAFGRAELDLRNPPRVVQTVLDHQPDIILNAAAYNDVDRAESEPDSALAVNAAAPGLMARTAAQEGALFVHFSTDYVFDGRSSTPYRENDPPGPLNLYGHSKLAGEQAVLDSGGRHLIFRTSWVYSLRRASFVTKVLSWASDSAVLRIADDQWGSPTWCRILADASLHAVTRLVSESDDGRLGLFHLACRGAPSRYELAAAVLEASGLGSQTELERASAGEFPAPALRPQFSALDSSAFEAAFDYRLPGWKEALTSAFAGGTSPAAPHG